MKHLGSVARYALIVLICLICLAPFYILIILALSSPEQVFYEGNMFLPDFQFQNFAAAWNKSHIGNAILNSAIITAGSMLIAVFFGAMAGYSIARFPRWYNKAIFAILLSCMMIPGIINTVPLYIIMRSMGAVDTLWGMILVCSTLAIPSSVFVYTGFIKSSPKELEEAAIIDGCNWFSAFWCITFHIIKPATSAVVILNAFGVWNNYAQAVFFLQSQKKHNVPQALSVFFQQFAGAKWNLMASSALIAIIPVVIAFLVFQKQLMRGLTDGALKG